MVRACLAEGSETRRLPTTGDLAGTRSSSCSTSCNGFHVTCADPRARQHATSTSAVHGQPLPALRTG
ncbi:hypothetical protein QJS66_12995 [Kocuria rhizophila]|nr:hypothetical protein QJS66_12995 [Kocuria rhizophila]